MTLRRGLVALLFLYAAALLSIGINKDWRLAHEDDGAVYTSTARSHVVLGLKETRAHDLFVNPHTGERAIYGHHPPLPSLILAGVFKLTGNDRPWVVRTVAIVFTLVSLSLFLLLLRDRFGFYRTLAAGFLFVTLPMGAFFGRVFTHIVLGLVPVLIQLLAYDSYKRTGEKKWAAACCAGVVFGGWMDWPPLFFSLSLWLAEAWEWWKTRKDGGFLAALAFAGIFVFSFNLAHLYYAGQGSLKEFTEAFARNARVSGYGFGPLQFLGTWIDYYRRYFSHAGLLASLFVGYSLLRGAPRDAAPAWRAPLDPILSRTLGVLGAGAVFHILAAPSYAKVHHYYYFFFLPFASASIVLGWGFLMDWAGRKGLWVHRIAAGLVCLDVLAVSAYVLRLRHTREESFALRITEGVRKDFLLPRYLEKEPAG